MQQCDRKTHIERVYGKDEGGVDNSDCWVDLELLDRFTTYGARGQKTIHHFVGEKKQQDPADCKGGREYEKLRIENPEDKTQYINVKIWDTYKADGIIKTKRHYENKQDCTKREVEPKKVVHRPISGQFLDKNRKPPKDPEEYMRAIKKSGGIKKFDNKQYVLVDLTGRLISRGKYYGWYNRPVWTVRNQATKNHFELKNKTVASKLLVEAGD